MKIDAILRLDPEFAETVMTELDENGFSFDVDFTAFYGAGWKIEGVKFFDADCLRWALDQMEG